MLAELIRTCGILIKGNSYLQLKEATKLDLTNMSVYVWIDWIICKPTLVTRFNGCLVFALCLP